MILKSTLALAATIMPRLGASLSLIMIFSLQSVPALAQRRVRYGLEGGAALTNFVGGAVTENDWRTSPWIGVTIVDDRPGAVVGLQSGLQVVSKGPAFHLSGGGITSVRLRYLEVPILLRIGPARPASRVRPVLLVGGAVGLRVGCSVPLAGTTARRCDNSFFGPQTAVQRVDAGLTIGGEVAVPYRKRLVLAPMVRYTHGLRNVGEDGTDNYHFKNSVFQIGIGIRAR